MVKMPSFMKFLKNKDIKNDKPGKQPKASFSFAKKQSGKKDNNTFFDMDGQETSETADIEETPADDAVIPDAPKKQIKKKQSKISDNKNSEPRNEGIKKASKTPKQNNTAYKTRSELGIKGFFVALKDRIAGVFGAAKTQKTNNNAALKFAENKKQTGILSSRNKRIALYAGGGLAIVAVVVLIVFLSGGEVASTQATPIAESTVAEAALANSATETPNEGRPISSGDDADVNTPSSIATTTPVTDPTTPPIETTAPDVTTTPIDIDDLVDCFMVDADLYYNKVGYSSNYYEYTEEEWFVLAQVIDGEAGSQTWEGKIAVGNVVMNRVLAPGYPGSDIITVITARSQFSGYSANNVPNSASKRAARAVLDKQVWTVPQHSFNFNSHLPEGEDWGSGVKKHSYWKKIDNHNFYVDQDYNRSRCRLNAIPPALFERTYKWPRYGCKPEDRVYRIQYMLKSFGYDVPPDKYFGMDTVKALKKYQEKKGLDADGVAGPSTIKALINSFGLSEYYQKFCM